MLGQPRGDRPGDGLRRAEDLGLVLSDGQLQGGEDDGEAGDGRDRVGHDLIPRHRDLQRDIVGVNVEGVRDGRERGL
eukprot:5298425-Pyramimonas_sp.AAC.1